MVTHTFQQSRKRKGSMAFAGLAMCGLGFAVISVGALIIPAAIGTTMAVNLTIGAGAAMVMFGLIVAVVGVGVSGEH